MAHNTYVRSGGIWGALTNLLNTEMQSLDVTSFKAVNGDDGGTWAPSSPIVVGGFGLQVSGALNTTFPPNYTTPLPVTNYAPGVTFLGGTAWGYTATYLYPYVQNSGVSPGPLTVLLHSLPIGMVITSVSLNVAAVVAGSLPTSMPYITFYSSPPYPPALTTIGNASDPSATLGAYNSNHLITLSGISTTVSSSSSYWLILQPASGGGAASGFTVGLVQVSGTLATLRTA